MRRPSSGKALSFVPIAVLPAHKLARPPDESRNALIFEPPDAAVIGCWARAHPVTLTLGRLRRQRSPTRH
jgi:hypothetical protein